MMTDAEILSKVKTGLMITGNQFDDALMLHIGDVKEYLKLAGVPLNVIESEASVGVILRGVSDLWSNSPGLSNYFFDRATQLALSGGDKNV